jgi:hypothetical protein
MSNTIETILLIVIAIILILLLATFAWDLLQGLMDNVIGWFENPGGGNNWGDFLLLIDGFY